MGKLFKLIVIDRLLQFEEMTMMMQKQPRTTYLGESPIVETRSGPTDLSSTKCSLGLVEALVKENSMFKHQQQFVSSELCKLRAISQSLLSENIQLRSLYKERTRDISKTINTFTVHAQHATDDYEHQQFLVRQLNCGLLKHIKLLMKEKEQTSQSIDSKSDEYTKLNIQKMRFEQQVVNRLKIKLSQNLNSKAVRECQFKQEQQSDSLNQLIEQVNDILMANKEIANLIYKYKLSPVQRQDILQQKEEFSIKLAFTIDQNNKYRKQISNDQQELAYTQNQAANKLKQYTTVKNQLVEEIRKYQQANKDHQNLAELEVNIKKAIYQSRQQRQIHGSQLTELTDNRDALTYQVDSLRKGLRKLKQTHFNKKIEVQCSGQQKISSIRQVIAKNNFAGEDQIVKLKRELGRTTQLISSCELDCKSLAEQVSQYSQTVGKLTNPIFEIEKIEGMLRLRRPK